MAFKTFAVGEVLEASEVNDYLMKQTVVVCTSGTKPSSPPDGMHIFETDTSAVRVALTSAWYQVYDLGGWTSYTPTWTGATSNPAILNGTLEGFYKQTGRVINFRIMMQAGTTTTYGSGPWSFALPSAFPVKGNTAVNAFADDFSTSFRYGGSAWLEPSVDQVFRIALGSGGNTGVASTVPFTWAVTDRLLITGSYEADI